MFPFVRRLRARRRFYSCFLCSINILMRHFRSYRKEDPIRSHLVLSVLCPHGWTFPRYSIQRWWRFANLAKAVAAQEKKSGFSHVWPYFCLYHYLMAQITDVIWPARPLLRVCITQESCRLGV